MTRAAAFASLFALAAVLPAANTVTPPPAAGTTQEVLVLTAGGPVRVRLSATINGKPADDAWRAAVNALFDYCDRDGNGALDPKERAVFTRERGRDYFEIDGMYYETPTFPHLKLPPSGDVRREEFAAAFRAAGLGPLTLKVFKPQTLNLPSRSKSGGKDAPPVSEVQALTDALFKHLDTDKDGKLSAAELKAARERLAPLDANEDELITPAELLETGPRGYGEEMAYDSQQPDAPKEQVDGAVVAPAGQPLSVKAVFAARDKNKDGFLTAEELTCASADLAAWDVDKDGKLDMDEAAAWLRGPVDLDLKAAFVDPGTTGMLGSLLGRAGSTASLSASPVGPPRKAGTLRLDPDGVLLPTSPDRRFTFGVNPGAGRQARSMWDQATLTTRTVFALLVKGEAGLDRKRLADNPNAEPALAMFDFADRNADGKVTRAEVTAVLAAVAPTINCRVSVGITDQGRGLFDLLDANGDRLLSPRELAAAPALLAAHDLNNDGKLGRTEIPRVVPTTADLASLPFLPNIDAAVSVGPRAARRTKAKPTLVGVPEWFTRMDRNGDGDVSAREFLGPPALFRKLDRDGDGLLSPDEARKATAEKK